MRKWIVFALVAALVIGICATISAQITFSQADLEETVPINDLLSLANDFITRRTSALVDTAQITPDFALANNAVRESMSVFAAEQLSLAELNARRSALRKWGEAYTRSVTKLTLQCTNIEGGVATLYVEEFTKLYYAKIHVNEPDYTAWISHRRFVFANGAAGWELVSQELLNNGDPVPVNEPTGVMEDAMHRIFNYTKNETMKLIDKKINYYHY